MIHLPELQGDRLAPVLRALSTWRERLQAALRCPPVSEQGVEITVTVSTSDTRVAHQLGARPRGWIVLRATGAPAAIAEISSDADHLVLRATATATFTIWVWP